MSHHFNIDATNLTAEQKLALAKQKARDDTMQEYETMIGKRSQSFYRQRLKKYTEAIEILNGIIA